MARLSINLPAIYGDHHVLEVRQILLELPGIDEIYVSSCFQVVEIIYDASQLDEDTIIAKLEAAGYSDDWKIPSEPGVPVYGIDGNDTYLRHTAAYQQTRQVIGFAQDVKGSERALWPCPGMGVIRDQDGGENDG